MTAGIGPLWQRSIIIKTPCDSTAEAELYQLQHVAKTGLWAVRLLRELDIPVTLKIFEDCQPAIDLIESCGMSQSRRVKHIDAKCWWLKYYIDEGDIEIEWLDTNKMIADQYTKLLDPIYKYKKAIKVVSGKHGYRISHIDNLENNDLTKKDV